MNEERHPWMKGFTIAALILGIIVTVSSFSVMTYDGWMGLLTLLAGGLLIGGPVWLLKISDGFKKWSSLTNGQRALGTLIMMVGAYAGIAGFVVIAALKSELMRRD